MDVNITHQGNVVVIEVGGRVDHANVVHLVEAMDIAVKKTRPRIVLDMAHVTLLTSAGLRAVLQGLHQARAAGGDVRIAAPSDAARVALEAANLHRMLPMYQQTASAIRSYTE